MGIVLLYPICHRIDFGTVMKSYRKTEIMEVSNDDFTKSKELQEKSPNAAYRRALHMEEMNSCIPLDHSWRQMMA